MTFSLKKRSNKSTVGNIILLQSDVPDVNDIHTIIKKILLESVHHRSWLHGDLLPWCDKHYIDLIQWLFGPSDMKTTIPPPNEDLESLYVWRNSTFDVGLNSQSGKVDDSVWIHIHDVTTNLSAEVEYIIENVSHEDLAELYVLLRAKVKDLIVLL